MSEATPLYNYKPAEPQAYKLSELLDSIQGVLKRSFYGQYWVIAEVTDPGYHARTGHWYMQLAQAERGQVVARIQGNMWAGVAQHVIPKFQSTTGSTIQAGMELMMYVSVSMHSVYGLSLNIHDINPEYTLGYLERIKLETIKKLEEEGVLELNKKQHLPRFIQRVAIISSDTAAGWGDFRRQIEQNLVGRLINLELFPATMQGENTTKSILRVLDKIVTRLDEFDTVVLIRGGGSRMDLAAFDEYILACNLANFPLPIITGIGHERDESVADLVAHTRLKTPTAVAEFLLRRAEDAVVRLFGAEDGLEALLSDIIPSAQRELQQETYRFQSILTQMEKHSAQHLSLFTQQIQYILQSVISTSNERITSSHTQLTRALDRLERRGQVTDKLSTRLTWILSQTSNKVTQSENRVNLFSSRLEHALSQLPQRAGHRLRILEQTAKLYDPTHTMSRGYLPVTQEGKKVTDTSSVDNTKPIQIGLLDGTITAQVTEISKE